MAVALYARYSSDRQNERSIADQLALGRRHAAARGWAVVAEFCDAAISGAAMANRPGLQALLAAAGAGAFDRVLVEDQDRLARNLEHEAHIFNRLKHLGVTLSTLAVDEVKILDVAFKGLMSELYLVQLGEKTRRGMHANAEAGLATGSRLYGYASQPGGATAIVPAEAAVVRKIFTAYAAGVTARDIAAALNDPDQPGGAVLGPRGGQWTASQVGGSRQRANGVLHTELYAGVKVWNRMQVKKDPATGKRLPAMRPPAEWKRTPVPHLRIVDQDLWDEVVARKAASGGKSPLTVTRQRHGGLFSGLLRCGFCGAAYTGASRGRLICAGHREKGDAACANSRTVARAEIEARVLQGLAERLLKPAAVAHYVRAYHAAWTAEVRERADARAPTLRRIAELGRQIERHLDDIEAGAITTAGRERLIAREAERETLRAQLAAGDDARPEAAPIVLHPGAAEHYAALVARLRTGLDAMAAGGAPADAETLAAVRALVLKIEISPRTPIKGGPVDLAVTGDLARFIHSPAEAGPPTRDRLVAGGDYRVVPGSFPVLLRA